MKIYITFGQAHEHVLHIGNDPTVVLDKDCVAAIECNSHEDGRNRAMHLFNGKFFTSYLECPDMSYFPRGVIDIPSDAVAISDLDNKPEPEVPVENRCMMENCVNEATKRPILLVWAKGVSRKNTRPLVAHLPIRVCYHCMTDDPSVYVSNAGWDTLRKSLMLRGKAEPDRKSLRVRYEELPPNTQYGLFKVTEQDEGAEHETIQYLFVPVGQEQQFLESLADSQPKVEKLLLSMSYVQLETMLKQGRFILDKTLQERKLKAMEQEKKDEKPKSPIIH